jgi:hypothetical protein
MANKDLTRDTTLTKELRDRGEAVRGLWAQRNNAYNKYEAMYNLNWETNAVTDPNLQATKTINPDPRNSCDGVVKLIEATDADFNVPFDMNSAASQEVSDAIENWCNVIFKTISRVRAVNLLHDMSLSASVLNEVHIGVIPTKLLLENAKLKASKANKMTALIKRYERLSKVTPFMWEIYDPRTGYPEFDSYGMSGYYRVVNNMTGADLVARFGSVAYTVGITDKNLQDKGEFAEWWDDTFHAVWWNGKIVMAQEHELPRIPIIAKVVGGTNSLFTKPEYQRAGFLHTLDKSRLWESQNIGLTAMASSVLRTASFPQMIYERMGDDATDVLEIDYSQAGGVVYAKRGSNVRPMDKKAIDPALREFLEVANQLSVESTIQRSALGQAIGASATFSMTSLLASQGRYVIVPIQKAISEACGDAMAATLEFAKAGLGAKMSQNGSVLELDVKQVPEDVYVGCVVDVKMPQDERANALMAIQLTNPQNPLASVRWVRENLLGMGQSKNMDQEITRETIQKLLAQVQVQQKAQQIMQQGQQQAAPQGMPVDQGGGQPLPNMPPGSMPSGVSPEQQMGMQMGGGTAPGVGAMPPSGALPPEFMQGGMQ